MLRNNISGNGYVGSAVNLTNFGIGLLNGGDNLIEENTVTGNVTGIRIQPASTGNVLRGNVIAGNPPILVSNNSPDNAGFAFDILNLSAAGANSFENNLCVTSMNAPCANLKVTPDTLPRVVSVVFDAPRVRAGGSFNASFTGSNLTNATYFDIRLRAPGGTSDEEGWNWQQGLSASHTVPRNTTLGDWTITGVRAHRDVNDHAGPYAAVQATISVFFSPF